jgi:hypothetical protein
VATELEDVAYLFRVLAEVDYRAASPLYERLAIAAADDPEVLALLLPAAPRDRLPHLLFASVQYLLLGEGTEPLAAFGATPYTAFREWCLERGDEIEALAATHFVQTNEVGRCSALLLCLASVAAETDRPLAVLEVGASAGLILGFDRYRYLLGESVSVGRPDAEVVLRPRIEGGPLTPVSMPSVHWRRGLDRSPVDVTDDEAVRWLRACIWPEQIWRQELFDRAVTVARRQPPEIVRGDAVENLVGAAAGAPSDAALCVLHTAVLSYLPDRPAFGAALDELAADRPVWWISGEPTGLVPGLPPPPTPTEGIAFLYGVVPVGAAGSRPRLLARGGPHGAWLEGLDIG